MTTTRGSVVQNRETKEYGFVRQVDNGRFLVKSIADGTPSRWHSGDDFVPASEADVPWLKLRTIPSREYHLFYWELPSGEMIGESEAVVFFDGVASVTRLSQVG
jgi:hypothetical protein